MRFRVAFRRRVTGRSPALSILKTAIDTIGALSDGCVIKVSIFEPDPAPEAPAPAPAPVKKPTKKRGVQ